MKTILIDYGASNLHSVNKALLRAGLAVEVTDDPDRAEDAAALVLPGQGHFGQVMRSFKASGFEPVVRRHLEAGRPFLGICVGLQLLLEGSEEAPEVTGLGLLPGMVKRFPAGARVPQMGWNSLRPHGRSPLLDGVEDGAYVYYANSYYADFDLAEEDPAADEGARRDGASEISGAYTTYGGVRFLGALSRGSLHATQFHPEKSQLVGLRILANFHKAVAEGRTEAA